MAVACMTQTSSWVITRAQQHVAAGRLEDALRLTSRELIGSNRAHTRRLIELHASILRGLGRTAEADAFADFVARYEAGENIYDVERDLTGRDCSHQQHGYELIRKWGRVDPGKWDNEEVVATFEIDAHGQIGHIRVLSALEPGAAWLGIDTIGHASIRTTRLAQREVESPDAWPISLCFYRNFGDPSERLPPDGRIRGSR
jgi:hypothetical protein